MSNGLSDEIVTLVTDEAAAGRRRPLQALATRAYVDTVGTMLLGASDPAFAMFRDAVLASSSPAAEAPPGSAPSAPDAARLRGFAAHLTDFDDFSPESGTHPSAVLVAAALALEERCRASGPDLLDAYLAGYHVVQALGAAVGPEPFDAVGWHRTPVFGAIGATVVSARLLRLSPRETHHALAIAGSLAGGNRSVFGTLGKPVNVGNAAATGVMAASCAAAGLTSTDSPLEGPVGYLATFLGPAAVETVSERIVEGLRDDGATVAAAPGIKPLPICTYGLRSAEALLDVAAEKGDREVASCTVSVHPGGVRGLTQHTPTTAFEARFSMEYFVALALGRGRIGLDDFADDRVPANLAQAAGIVATLVVDERDTPPIGPARWHEGYAVADVELTDGSHLTARVDDILGDRRRPMSDSELDAKFLECASTAGHSDAEGLLRRLRQLGTTDGPSSVVAAMASTRAGLVGAS